MIYDIPAIVSLAQRCAPDVATEAVVPLVVTESGGDSLQINVNKGPRVRARSSAGGAAIVRRYMMAGYTVDVGLAQINSANLSGSGVTIEQAFEPCTNLALAGAMIRQGYARASRHYTGLDAISATYSLYNTGTLTRGFRNGYVDRVWSVASRMGSIQSPPPLPHALLPSDEALAPAVKPVSDRDGWVVGPVASDQIEVFK
ncbi:type VI secretion protein (plasmid) [Sphingomonas paeninsulae]|uniref:Type VI secretion protein n=1 Tax=Sphingomonas paeninsulae TaxID=2319844 RepID=A0A494TBP5_SPHPE|nr:lytic transglycosylase domain-containing protein [Sphingomonas paeninsulae]AYJ84664.1 type VI secretion protein [Sphingomonas paeninsulae]